MRLDRRSGIGSDLLEDGAELRLDRAERRFAVADQIHLVDGHEHMAHPQKRRNICMAPRLNLYALAGVDQHDRGICGRFARGHVACVLLVAWRVRDDELAPRRGEVAVRHVDRDALLTLGAQPVGQQREIDLSRCGRSLALDRLHLVFIHRLRVVEQPPDEGRFAVVYAARRGEAQQVLLALAAQKVLDRK